jgi:hypothetical protein
MPSTVSTVFKRKTVETVEGRAVPLATSMNRGVNENLFFF